MADAYVAARGTRECRECRRIRESRRVRPQVRRIPAGCVPAAPLTPLVRSFVADNGGGHDRRGLKDLSRRYAARFNRSQRAAERWLSHLAFGDFHYVREDRADELLTMLGSHLSLVYPEMYYDQEAV